MDVYLISDENQHLRPYSAFERAGFSTSIALMLVIDGLLYLIFKHKRWL